MVLHFPVHMPYNLQILMESNIHSREYGWTNSSNSNISDDFLSNEEDEVPFARHEPIVKPDPEDTAI